ncbi:hypothetical protein BaRGS_00013732 [Batillaria attramentaria]|uniref:Uncharacterized protein n=1 Tax=Batillaria attramentaria TaxID=370345 RepID=A0ABD0L6K5_9CAEN
MKRTSLGRTETSNTGSSTSGSSRDSKYDNKLDGFKRYVSLFSLTQGMNPSNFPQVIRSRSRSRSPSPVSRRRVSSDYDVKRDCACDLKASENPTANFLSVPEDGNDHHHRLRSFSHNDPRFLSQRRPEHRGRLSGVYM